MAAYATPFLMPRFSAADAAMLIFAFRCCFRLRAIYAACLRHTLLTITLLRHFSLFTP